MPETLKGTKGRIRFEVKDADKGTVSALFCRLNVMDYDNDLILPGAFDDGAEVLISAYGHKTWWGEMPVGRGVIHVEKDVAIMDGQFWLDTVGGRETFLVVKNTGDLQEWSFGFDIIETGELTEDLRQKGVRRVIKKLQVYEVSPVMLGAGIDTETLAVKGKAPVQVPPAEQLPSVSVRAELARFEKTRASLLR